MAVDEAPEADEVLAGGGFGVAPAGDIVVGMEMLRAGTRAAGVPAVVGAVSGVRTSAMGTGITISGVCSRVSLVDVVVWGDGTRT